MRSFAEATAHPQVLLDTIARRTAEAFGAFCGITMVSDDGQLLKPVAIFDADPASLEILNRLVSTAPFRLDVPHPLTRSIQTNECTLIPAVTAEQLRSRFDRV